MEDNYKNKAPRTIQHAMQYGLWIGLLFILETIFSSRQSSAMSLMTYFVQALVLIQSYRYAKDFRDTETGGKISFFQVFAYVLNLFFFASLIGALFQVVYYKYINPTYLSTMLEQVRPVLDQMLSKNSDYAEMSSKLDTIFSAEQMAMYGMAGKCFIGMVLGLIYAPFIKRNTEETQSSDNQ